MENLNRDDLNVLIEAVDSWVDRRLSGMIIGDVLTMMVIRDKEEATRMREEERKKIEQGKNVDKERGALLKAKLIQIRDTMDVESITK